MNKRNDLPYRITRVDGVAWLLDPRGNLVRKIGASELDWLAGKLLNICLSVRVQMDGSVRPFDSDVIVETIRSALTAAIELEIQLRALTAGLDKKRGETP